MITNVESSQFEFYMAKNSLSESEQKIINEVRDLNFREQLAEGFQNGTLMTSDEFCQRLETFKSLLMKKYQMRYGNNR